MTLLTHHNAIALWQQTIQEAEQHCAVHLKQELETYLVSLLYQYTDKSEIVKQTLAITLLEAKNTQNDLALQQTGDQCLLFAGLFPKLAAKKLVKISYFVHLGQFAYIELFGHLNDRVFYHLAHQFVTLMDVLQSIRTSPDLLPLEAYEQWAEVGSQRAFNILQFYTKGRALPK